jgi:hypothetical protein
MMKHLKQILIRGVIPFVIMGGIALIMNAQKMDSAQVRSVLIAGVIFTVVSASSVIYDVESWSIRKQSLIHFLVMLVTVLPCLIISGWFPLSSAADYVKLLGVYLLTGAVIWSIMYFIFTKIKKS